MNEGHAGSDFDDFLREEGLLEEVEAVAAKRVLTSRASGTMDEREPSNPEQRPADSQREQSDEDH